MIQRSNIVLLVVILGFIATQVESLRFNLQSGETKCIAEDIKSHAMTVGKYHIVNHHEGYPLPDTHRITVRSCIAKDIKSHAMTVGKYHIVNSNEGYLLPDAHKITVRVTSTFGNTYHQSDNVIEGHFAFETAEAGDYMTCFFAADHKPALTLNIDFDWKTGVAAKDWTNVAKKGSVEELVFITSAGESATAIDVKWHYILVAFLYVPPLELKQIEIKNGRENTVRLATDRKRYHRTGVTGTGTRQPYWSLSPEPVISDTFAGPHRSVGYRSGTRSDQTGTGSVPCELEFLLRSPSKGSGLWFLLVFVVLKIERNQKCFNGGHGFKPRKQPLAEMQGKAAYDTPLWWGPSPDTTLSGSFRAPGCPFILYVMEFELKRMLENVQAIHDEMFFLREREAEMQELNRSTNSKMAWMTGLSILLCLSVAGLQVCGFIRQWVDDNVLNHISGKTHARSLWEHLESDFGTLSMGNETVSKVVGITTIFLETSTGSKLVLNNVNNAPDVRLHLISVGILDDEGYVSTNGGGKWKLIKGSLVVAHGYKRCGLY
ncbi:Transmembrane emp24 domain-containing protein p24delta10 [Capsicum annuum]|nr:Transmembrane emp24 domain-containing protein p24delta10 [Capsicum annuum]